MVLKAGFIGVGGIANSHLDHLTQIKGVKIAALCDVVEEKLRIAQKKYGGNIYTNYKEMLDKERLDYVYVCVPPFAHADIELDIAQRSIPFFVEKPVNLYLEKGREVEKVINEKNLITSVGYVLRYMDIIEKAKRILEEKKIALLLGRYFGEVPAAGEGWYSRREKSGGQIVEQATHVIDLMRYLVGEVDQIYAQGFIGLNKLKNYNVEDASIATLHFKKGAIGTLSSTWLLWSYFPSLEIITKGLQLQFSINSLKVISSNKEEEFQVKNDYAFLEDRIFIEAVKSGNSSNIKSDYSDGLKTLKVTLAANESMKKQKVIKL